MDWINYINFRDYLNKNLTVAKEYENLKVTLAAQRSVDNGRKYYLQGKYDFIVNTLREALIDSQLGKTAEIATGETNHVNLAERGEGRDDT